MYLFVRWPITEPTYRAQDPIRGHNQSVTELQHYGDKQQRDAPAQPVSVFGLQQLRLINKISLHRSAYISHFTSNTHRTRRWLM